MENFKFTLYDFVGYLIPGISFLFIFSFVNDIVFINNELIYDFKFNEKLKDLNFNTIQLIGILAFSYFLGQILSFLSSIYIEKIPNQLFNFPSKYLLFETKEKDVNFFKKSSLDKDKYILQDNFKLFLVYIVSLPIISYLFLKKIIFQKIFRCLRLNTNFHNKYTKTIDEPLNKVIIKKFLEHWNESYPEDKLVESRLEYIDFHRYISHFIYENNKNHNFKLTSYVTLYGYLRTMCFTFILCFWYIVIFKYFDFSTYSFYSFNFHSLLFILFLLLIICVLFFAFIKYYRRYTLEILMIFLTIKLEKNNKIKEEIFNSDKNSNVSP